MEFTQCRLRAASTCVVEGCLTHLIEPFLSVIYFLKVPFRPFVGMKAYCFVVKRMSLYVVPPPASYQNGPFLRPGVLGQISARDSGLGGIRERAHARSSRSI